VSRFALPLPSVAGLLPIGSPLAFTTLDYATHARRIELTLRDASAGDVVVEVTDGTTAVQATIPAAANRVTQAIADTVWPAGAVLTFEIVSEAGAGGGVNLDGFLVVDQYLGGIEAGEEGLLDLAAVEAALGITAPTAAQTAFLTRQLAAISARVRTLCGRWITPQRTYREVFREPTRIHLLELPAALVSVTAEGTSLDLAELVVTASGRLCRSGVDAVSDWYGYRDVEVVYTGGLAALPASIAELLLRTLEGQWRAYVSGGTITPAGPIKRITTADVGTVEYASAGDLVASPSFAVDPILGFAPAWLDELARPSLGLATASYETLEVIP